MALRLPQRSEMWLFDCGEGTQHQFLRSNLRLSQLRRVFITHMHGDHIFGLPGLLASLGLAGDSSGVDLFGPDPLETYLTGVVTSSFSRIGYPIMVHRVEQIAAPNKILMASKELNSTDYIEHHLTNLTYGKCPDGTWSFAAVHGKSQVAGPEATCNLSEMGFRAFGPKTALFDFFP